MHRTETPTRTVVLDHATVVAGDGTAPVHDGAVVLAGGRVAGVFDAPLDASEETAERTTVVDVDGDVVMPGIVDSHVHHVAAVPFSASASPPPSPSVAKRNRDRHIEQGATTVVSVDTFARPADVAAARRNHPLKIELGACPTPSSLAAARAADGSGLDDEHETYGIPEAVAGGAVVLGEVGSGSTLAGSLQRIRFVPAAVAERTGREITAAEADDLITAVIGRYADPDQYEPAAADAALADAGLRDVLDPDELRELVMDVTWPSVEANLEGFAEVAAHAERYGIPMMVHTAAASMDAIRELAERGVPLVAGHANHPTFEYDEALAFAAEIGSRENVSVDVSTWDLFTDSDRLPPEKQRRMRDQLVEFVDRGLVDTVTTDWSWQHPGGEWHSLLLPVRELVDRGVAGLGEAVELVTGAPARTYPAIGATRGTIEPGAAADVLVVDREDLTNVRRVYVDGRPALVDGELAY